MVFPEILFEIMGSKGSAQYGLEAVSQLEHGLQCAALAQEAGSEPALVIAALFHDIGHLIAKSNNAVDLKSEDGRHEVLGAAFLGQWFSCDVTGPIRLHVHAKRYLCLENRDYWNSLSDASKRSLQKQGGAFKKDEASEFLQRPYARDAIKLRKWDDRAKVPGRFHPGLDEYFDLVSALISQKDSPDA